MMRVNWALIPELVVAQQVAVYMRNPNVANDGNFGGKTLTRAILVLARARAAGLSLVIEEEKLRLGISEEEFVNRLYQRGHKGWYRNMQKHVMDRLTRSPEHYTDPRSKWHGPGIELKARILIRGWK